MARRVVFTDPETGRFISATAAAELENALRSVYDGGLIEQYLLRFGQVLEETYGAAEPNWEDHASKWGLMWESAEGELSLSALQDAGFPEGYDAFRVTYDVPDSDEYPRGYAMSDWAGPEAWPPDLSMLESAGPSGIARIHFRAE